MKEALLTTLRQATTSRKDFRKATEQLSWILACEASVHLERSIVEISTPLAKTRGEVLDRALTIIPILRAGLAMLPSFLSFFPMASVGFFGMRRDEETKEPFLYYQNVPKLLPNQNVIIIDPMIATGGSGKLALKHLKENGVAENEIIYVGIVAAPEGIKALKEYCPEIHLVVGKIDERLNDQAFIVPGIGDFGDRYFGTD